MDPTRMSDKPRSPEDDSGVDPDYDGFVERYFDEPSEAPRPIDPALREGVSRKITYIVAIAGLFILINIVVFLVVWLSRSTG